jgi:acyl-CoA thioesterase-2
VSDRSDLEWLGLERVGAGRWTFVLTQGLSRLDNKFYGGTGVATATAAMEAETGRRALWVSVQYVASGATGDRFECRVEVVASGRRTSQVRCSGWQGDRLVYEAIGAAGEARPDAVEVQFGTAPDVPAPLDCPRWAPRWLAALTAAGLGERPGWLSITDARAASEAGAMWMRMDGRPLTRATMAFLADVIPSGVLRAAGHSGGGTSLDNTVRFGPDPEGEWMLVDIDPHLVSGGYVHGAARLWSERGTLLGVASQTATAMIVGP